MIRATLLGVATFVLLISSASAGWFSDDNQPGYDRGLFRHWVNQGTEPLSSLNPDGERCRSDTRDQVLLKKNCSLCASKYSKPPFVWLVFTKLENASCRVIEGVWFDFYTGEVLRDPSKIDIDHVVPLKEAWNSGANVWPDNLRADFANDYMDNLVVTDQSINRSKGDKGISDWLPDQGDAQACDYIEKYIEVKVKYNLTFSKSEIDVIKKWNGRSYKAHGEKQECFLYSAFSRGSLYGYNMKNLRVRE